MPNHLAQETSPYLLQHAANPVNWYPWSEAALGRARAEDKPILLSIGYSACHWCHVMAHECFENLAIARYMNENFINIKVDREEHPDLDHLYMLAVEAMTGKGGWPLTVFLTPVAQPFFGGTYFPPEDRQGMPGFPRILKAVTDVYRQRREAVTRTTSQVQLILESEANPPVSLQTLTPDILKQAYTSLKGCFDRENGGFGGAPKFPHPMSLEFLLRYHASHPQSEALAMVELMLEKMAAGGLYDQLGGGFHRYSTDNLWLVPHFEKMLYDNALLARVYLYAYVVTGKITYRKVVEETLDYILREMTSPEGGFYSTQDADSEGVEGKYYLWFPREITTVLGERLGRRALDFFGVTQEGNLEDRNILHRAGAREPDDLPRIRALLLEARKHRIPPARDEKVLASWNGMVLAALAEAGSIIPRPDFILAAIRNAQFIKSNLLSGSGLKHTWKDGQARIEGYLEDYAQVIEGSLALHQATLQGDWLRLAVQLSEILVERFSDQTTGLLYDTGTGHPFLFSRPRNLVDGATPSGNSLATHVLLKMAACTGNERFKRIAEKALHSLDSARWQNPLGFSQWLCALDFFLAPPLEIAVLGARDLPETSLLLDSLYRRWLPNKILAGLDNTDAQALPTLPLFVGRKMLNGRPTVYVCFNHACRSPVTDSASLEKQLASMAALDGS